MRMKTCEPKFPPAATDENETLWKLKITNIKEGEIYNFPFCCENETLWSWDFLMLQWEWSPANWQEYQICKWKYTVCTRTHIPPVNETLSKWDPPIWGGGWQHIFPCEWNPVYVRFPCFGEILQYGEGGCAHIFPCEWNPVSVRFPNMGMGVVFIFSPYC